jgi:hypothetical protein
VTYPGLPDQYAEEFAQLHRVITMWVSAEKLRMRTGPWLSAKQQRARIGETVRRACREILEAMR